jgi:broad specificity phosphatase PhoE
MSSVATSISKETTVCFLARHCDVANPKGVSYGHLPNFGLSPKGETQGRAMGRYLAREPVQAIYSSPLQRAQETALLVQRQLAHPVPILERPDLVEAEFARYLQGTRHKDILWRKPLWYVHMIWPGLVPGDESVGAMHQRLHAVISEGLSEHRGQAFVCLSHGDPIQAFWVTTDGRPPWALHRLQCAKGGLLKLTYRGDSLTEKVYLSPDALAAAAGVEAAERLPVGDPEPAETEGRRD